MPGRLHSTKYFKEATRELAGHPLGANWIERDGKLIAVSGPENSLTLKTKPEQVRATELFYNMIKDIRFHFVRIVPVKTDRRTNVQKYFHRPSMRTLGNYLWNRVHPKIELRISELDRRLCEDLLNANPKIMPMRWLEMVNRAKRELEMTAHVRSYIDIEGTERRWRFGFSNFIVFGVDGRGVLKAGFVDV